MLNKKIKDNKGPKEKINHVHDKHYILGILSLTQSRFDCFGFDCLNRKVSNIAHHKENYWRKSMEAHAKELV